MKRYRPSGRLPFGGLIGLILATIIGSLIIGGLVFAVSHLIYLIVLFPFIMGALGGGLLSLVVKSSKVRSPIIAGLFGIIMGIGIIGTVHFLDYYITDRNEFRAFVIEEMGEDVPQEEVDAFLDEFLLEETGSSGFIGDLKFNAQQGTTITRTSSEITLDENGTWVYWGVELLIVALLGAGMAFSAARQPFNEEVGEWYPDPFYVGTVNWKSRKDFLSLVKNGDTNDVFQMISQNTNAARNPVVEKPVRSFSLGDFISFVSALMLAIVFVAVPWLQISGVALTGLELVSKVQPVGNNDMSMLFIIPIAALFGSVAGVLGLASARSRGATRAMALIAGIIGLAYYVLFFVQYAESSTNLTGMVGIGFWIGLVANIGLFFQAFIPRSGSANAAAARLDLVAYQTPNAPNSDVVLGINSITMNRNREISSNVMKVLLTPQEFADLNRMLSSGQSVQPSTVQFSGLGGSLE